MKKNPTSKIYIWISFVLIVINMISDFFNTVNYLPVSVTATVGERWKKIGQKTEDLSMGPGCVKSRQEETEGMPG